MRDLWGQNDPSCTAQLSVAEEAKDTLKAVIARPGREANANTVRDGPTVAPHADRRIGATEAWIAQAVDRAQIAQFWTGSPWHLGPLGRARGFASCMLCQRRRRGEAADREAGGLMIEGRQSWKMIGLRLYIKWFCRYFLSTQL